MPRHCATVTSPVTSSTTRQVSVRAITQPRNTASCQNRAGLVSWLASTCLTWVHSRENTLMSLPNPGDLFPPCGISEVMGMWSLSHTHPAWIFQPAICSG